MDEERALYVAPLRAAARWCMDLAGDRLMSIEALVLVSGAAEDRARAYCSILVKRRALAWDGDHHVRRGPKWDAWYQSQARTRPKAGEPGEEQMIDGMRRRLCAEIQRQREAKGWTMKDLADVSGVHHNVIAKAERRARPPSACCTTLIARALGVTVEQLCAPSASLG